MIRPRMSIAALATLHTLAAHAVTIECESATGPAGGTVTVAIRMAVDPGEEVAGAQNDIAIDTTVFDAANPAENSPNCTLNPAIGPGTVPDKRLADSFISGPQTVRAIVFSQQNQLPIPPGVLYTCTLRIAAAAARQSYPLELFDPVVSDPEGDRLPVETLGCQIEVTDPPTPLPTATPPGFCNDTEDCPPGQVCIDNRCATLTPTPIGYCEDEDDCPPGQICVDNRCATPIPTPTPIGFCRDDEDCPDGSVCIDNRCATPTPIGFCNDTEDCPPGQICVDNRCSTVTPTPIGFCEDEDDCAPGEVCVDNRCATPTVAPSGGGGGCSCSVEPDPPARAALNMMLALLPIAWLLGGRRRSERRG